MRFDVPEIPSGAAALRGQVRAFLAERLQSATWLVKSLEQRATTILKVAAEIVRRQDGFGVAPGSTGDAMWAGAWGTSFTIDPREGIVGIIMGQGPSTRVHTRMLFKNLIYGAVVR